MSKWDFTEICWFSVSVVFSGGLEFVVSSAWEITIKIAKQNKKLYRKTILKSNLNDYESLKTVVDYFLIGNALDEAIFI